MKRPFDTGRKDSLGRTIRHSGHLGADQAGELEPDDDLLDSAEPEPAPELIAARETLFDALDVLGRHRAAVTLVGAQAVYEHTQHFREVPPTFTQDGDLSVDRDLISAEPNIAHVLEAAGFENLRDRPGIWLRRDGTSVDLLAPEATAGPGNRGVRLVGQAKKAIGRAAGLELALLDHGVRTLDSFQSPRSHEINVAGPAALICAKAYKLAERLDEAQTGRNRVKPKDAGDVYRLMSVTDPADIRKVIRRGETHRELGAAIRQSREHFESVFADGAAGIDLAIQDLGGVLPPAHVRQRITAWMRQFRS